MRDGLVFAALIERVTGIVLPERDFRRLEHLSKERAVIHGLPDFRAYIRMLRRQPDSSEWRYLLKQITVKESSLFRGPAQFRALCEHIIPERIAAGRRELKIWSAGCARGEEPATIALVLADCGLPSGCSVRIYATDVDREAMNEGRNGVYSARSVRKIPPAMLEKCFLHRDEKYQLKEIYRERIGFQYFNLVDSPYPEDWKDFDIIFLRNVLIYFREKLQAKVLNSVVKSMAEGAYLFVGPSESLWYLQSGLSREAFHSCFAYRKNSATKKCPQLTQRKTREKVSEIFKPTIPDMIQQTESGTLKKLRRTVTSPFCPVDRQQVIRALISGLSRACLDDSLEILKHAEEDPTNPLRRGLEGLVFKMKGERERALHSFRAALYLDEDLYQIRYLLARELVDQGWKKRAASEYHSVLLSLKMGGGRELPELTAIGIPGRLSLIQLCSDGLNALEEEAEQDPDP